MSVIGPHEPLHSHEAPGGFVAESSCHRLLIVEEQAVLTASGVEVKLHSNPQKKLISLGQRLVVLRLYEAVQEQVVVALGTAADPRRPEEPVKVSQPAFALFDLGFKEEDRLTVPGEARSVRRPERSRESCFPAQPGGSDPPADCVIDDPTSRHETEIQQRYLSREILLRRVQNLFQAPLLVTYVETRIPEGSQQAGGELGQEISAETIRNNQQVHIRMWTQHLSTVATGRDDADTLLDVRRSEGRVQGKVGQQAADAVIYGGRVEPGSPAAVAALALFIAIDPLPGLP